MELTYLLQNLQKAQSLYEGVIGRVEYGLSDIIEFDFSIQWQPSDGWTIVSAEAKVAPFESVIKIAEQKGEVSMEDFLRICI